jgi:hypothetical protein
VTSVLVFLVLDILLTGVDSRLLSDTPPWAEHKVAAKNDDDTLGVCGGPGLILDGLMA